MELCFIKRLIQVRYLTISIIATISIIEVIKLQRYLTISIIVVKLRLFGYLIRTSMVIKLQRYLTKSIIAVIKLLILPLLVIILIIIKVIIQSGCEYFLCQNLN